MNRVGLAATLGVAAFSLSSCGSKTPEPAPVGPSSSETTSSSSALTTGVASMTLSSGGASTTSATTGEASQSGTHASSSSAVSPQTTSSAATGSEQTSASDDSSTTGSNESVSSTNGTSDSASSEGGTLRLTSPSLEWSPECTTSTPDTCSIFPNDNISYMDNANISPAFEWTGVPVGTQSFALTLKDVTFGQPLWAIWNIPGDEMGLPADLPKDTTTLDVPAGAEQSNSTFATGEGYFGPESPCNVFQFDLFALSIPTYEPKDKEYAAEVDAQLNQLGDVVLGHATLTGRTKYNSTCE